MTWKNGVPNIYTISLKIISYDKMNAKDDRSKIPVFGFNRKPVVESIANLTANTMPLKLKPKEAAALTDPSNKVTEPKLKSNDVLVSKSKLYK